MFSRGRRMVNLALAKIKSSQLTIPTSKITKLESSEQGDTLNTNVLLEKNGTISASDIPVVIQELETSTIGANAHSEVVWNDRDEASSTGSDPIRAKNPIDSSVNGTRKRSRTTDPSNQVAKFQSQGNETETRIVYVDNWNSPPCEVASTVVSTAEMSTTSATVHPQFVENQLNKATPTKIEPIRATNKIDSSGGETSTRIRSANPSNEVVKFQSQQNEIETRIVYVDNWNNSSCDVPETVVSKADTSITSATVHPQIVQNKWNKATPTEIDPIRAKNKIDSSVNETRKRLRTTEPKNQLAKFQLQGSETEIRIVYVDNLESPPRDVTATVVSKAGTSTTSATAHPRIIDNKLNQENSTGRVPIRATNKIDSSGGETSTRIRSSDPSNQVAKFQSQGNEIETRIVYVDDWNSSPCDETETGIVDVYNWNNPSSDVAATVVLKTKTSTTSAAVHPQIVQNNVNNASHTEIDPIRAKNKIDSSVNETRKRLRTTEPKNQLAKFQLQGSETEIRIVYVDNLESPPRDVTATVVSKAGTSTTSATAHPRIIDNKLNQANPTGRVPIRATNKIDSSGGETSTRIRSSDPSNQVAKFQSQQNETETRIVDVYNWNSASCDVEATAVSKSKTSTTSATVHPQIVQDNLNNASPNYIDPNECNIQSDSSVNELSKRFRSTGSANREEEFEIEGIETESEIIVSDNRSIPLIDMPTISSYRERSATSSNVHSAVAAAVQADVMRPGSKAPSDTKYKRPRRPCPFCGKLQAHLSRHIKRMHKNEKAVAACVNMPKHEKIDAFTQFRKDGIFNANQEITKKSSTTKEALMRERKRGIAKKLMMCGGCKGFFNSLHLSRHSRRCRMKESSAVGGIDIPALLLSGNKLDRCNFRTKVLKFIRHDAIGLLCLDDPMILKVGQRQFEKSTKKNRKQVMSEMRRLSKLLIKFRIVCENSELSGEDIFDRNKFTSLEEAIQLVADESKSPLRIALGYSLKTAAKVLKGHYLIERQDAKAAEMDMFLNVLDLNWGYVFSDAVSKIALKRQEKLRRPAEMPLESDVVCVRDYIFMQLRKMLDDIYLQWGLYEFNRLRSLIVTRLTLFNARRGGEPARLLLREWTDAENGVWIDPQLVAKIDDPIEKKLIGKYKLAYQAGKGSTFLVPLLIPLDMLEAIRKLVVLRGEVGIADSNAYLFPTSGNSDGCASGWHSVNEVCVAAGVVEIRRMTATKMRHRASTLYALEDIPVEERAAFYRHMGHGKDINEHVYQSPLAILEICKVGRYFDKLDRDAGRSNERQHEERAVNSYSDRIIEENNASTILQTSEEVSEEEDEIVSKTNRKRRMIESDEGSSSGDEYNDEELGSSQSTGQRKKKNSGTNSKSVTGITNTGRKYTRWSDAESKAVMDHFTEWIEGKKEKLPGKQSILDFLSEKKINKDWKTTKTKIFNEKMKREKTWKDFSRK